MIKLNKFAVGIGMLSLGVSLQASAQVFVTPSGAMTGGQAVDASATFTDSGGVLVVTLNDLEANPTSVVQTISGLDLVLSNGATTGTLSSSSAQQITVNSGGSFTLGSTGPTGWVLNGISGGVQLDGLGAGSTGPAGLIIGPPNGSTYSAAMGSIAGNGPHNPFLNQSATFDIAGLGSGVTVTGATFVFGTTAGANTVRGVGSAPEIDPASAISGLALLVGGLVVLRGRKQQSIAA